jgi:hypothetical protein
MIMPTPYRRTLVSLAATLTMTLALAACAGSYRAVPRGLTTLDSRPHEIRFDNDGRQHVHVYLVGDSRQWLLGRVEPGARATLSIPAELAGENAAPVRLVVLMGERITLEAARHAQATLSVPMPAGTMLSRRWWFAQGDLMSLGR